MVAAWAALPLLGWAMAGDITPLILLVAVFALTVVLRQTTSWQHTMMAAILVGVGAELALRLRPDFLVLLTEQVELFLASGGEMPDMAEGSMQQVLVSLFGLMHMFIAICLTMVARWWQAVLYNPGGFQQEFHQFRFQPWAAMLLTGLFLLAGFGVTALSGWTMYFVLPLFFAGIALVHGWIGLKKLSRLWLIAFYMLMLNPPLAQLLAVFAIMDSWYDFRGRIQKQS